MSKENENFLLKIKSNLRKRVTQETSEKKEPEINNNKKIETSETTEKKVPEIKNELTDTKTIEVSSSSLKDGEHEKDKQKNVDKIIKKWLNLQKIIKEEITLEDVIVKQQENDSEKQKN